MASRGRAVGVAAAVWVTGSRVAGVTSVAAARQEGDRLLVNAEAAAQQRRDEADRYAARVLEELAEKLRIVTKQVDNGLDLLRQNLDLEQRPSQAQSQAPQAQQKQPAQKQPAQKQ